MEFFPEKAGGWGSPGRLGKIGLREKSGLTFLLCIRKKTLPLIVSETLS